MIRKYTIVLKSPMGPKDGSLSIYEENGIAEGVLECLRKKHKFSGNITKEGKLVLEGIFQSPLGEEPFTLECEITETQLNGKFKRNEECYEILGVVSPQRKI